MSVSLDSINTALGNLTNVEQTLSANLAENTATLNNLAAQISALGSKSGGITQADLDAIAGQISNQATNLQTMSDALAAADAAALGTGATGATGGTGGTGATGATGGTGSTGATGA